MTSMEGNEMAKKLLINCASCDARKLQEENYSAYESITVNAATVLASEASKAVMNRRSATMSRWLSVWATKAHANPKTRG